MENIIVIAVFNKGGAQQKEIYRLNHLPQDACNEASWRQELAMFWKNLV